MTYSAEVTVCVMAHARTRLLAEALHSALTLHAPDGIVPRILVINDCPEQWLRCTDPRVQVENIVTVFPTLGHKRNFVLSQVQTEWMTWLDDDDMLLPHHLDRLLLAEGSPCIMPKHGFWFNGEKGEVKGAAANDLVVKTQLLRDLGGYALDPTAQEEWNMMGRLRASTQTRVAGRPSYVERWGNGAYHLSGQGANTTAHQRFRAHALDIVSRGVEPRGDVTVEPRPPAFDFLAACEALVQRHHAP